MSPSVLQQRLAKSVEHLKSVQSLAAKESKGLDLMAARYDQIANQRSNLEEASRLLDVREAARQYLTDLGNDVHSDGRVQLGSTRVDYSHARFFALQGFLGTTWAVSDRVTAVVGEVDGAHATVKNPNHPLQLCRDFIKEDKAPSRATNLLCRERYGYYILWAYAVRNHFVHDGAFRDGNTFFTGPTSATAFAVSDDGWKRVTRRVQEEYSILPNATSRHEQLSAHQGDLRDALDLCHREMDDCLGVLAVGAAHSLLARVEAVLGRDLK